MCFFYGLHVTHLIFLQPDIVEGEWNRELISKTAKEIDSDVGCVIACIDYYVSYIKTLKAVTYLNNPEVIFLTTNLEDRHSYQNGIISPGEGAFALFLFLLDRKIKQGPEGEGDIIYRDITHDRT